MTKPRKRVKRKTGISDDVPAKLPKGAFVVQKATDNRCGFPLVQDMTADEAHSKVVETIDKRIKQVYIDQQRAGGGRYGQALRTRSADIPGKLDVHVHDKIVQLGKSTLTIDDLRCTTIEYPANWWEALKQRFAPDWVKERWPVDLVINRAWVRVTVGEKAEAMAKTASTDAAEQELIKVRFFDDRIGPAF